MTKAEKEIQDYCRSAREDAELGHPESIEVSIERVENLGRSKRINVHDYVAELNGFLGLAYAKAAERMAEFAFNQCREIGNPSETLRIARAGLDGVWVDRNGNKYINGDGRYTPMGKYSEDDLNYKLLCEAQETARKGYDESALREARRLMSKSNLSAKEKTEFNARLHKRASEIERIPDFMEAVREGLERYRHIRPVDDFPNEIMIKKAPITPSYDPERLTELIKRFTDPDKEKRPDANQILHELEACRTERWGK